MKALKLISFALLLMSNAVWAADDAAKKTDNSSTSSASDTNDKAPAKSESSASPSDASKKEDANKKDNTSTKTRAIGSLLANKAKKPAVAGDSGSDKRIQELEELVQQQQKLIEMYKKQK